jgi:arginyl-tRNA synthetase
MKAYPIDILTDRFFSAVKKAFPNLPEAVEMVEVTPSTNDKFGHYQCNSAMKIAKLAKSNPRAVAEMILKEVERTDVIEMMEIAGPGFINITLSTIYLAKMTQNMVGNLKLGIESPEQKKKIVVDFSSPNTAKEMHVGHLRSTIIGDSLCRLFEFMGHDVLRLNHIGDWGTAFGMLITHMKEKEPKVLSGEKATDLSHLVGWYKESKGRFDAEPDFKKRSQLEVVNLQGGDPAALKAWNVICEISRKAYQEIYDLLGIRLIERGESYYNPLLAKTVQELEEKKIVQISDGAKCIFLDGFINREGEPLPLMVQKSDGGYNYDTTDMAAIKQRIFEERADRIIYVTDAGQATHFDMVFKAAEKAGWLDPSKVRVDHVPFGLVLGLDGKKFKTRSGETEKLRDLIDTAIKKAEEILAEREVNLPAEDLQHLAKALGIGAIKYADLSCNRTSDYTFSYEKMLRFEGNTAAYLMYSYVRTQSILRKVGMTVEQIEGLSEKIVLEHPSEISLGLHLAQFGETLDRMSDDLRPNRLTDYLYTLAEKFNAFFRDCRVEGSPEQNRRLLLCAVTGKVLKRGLDLVGVEAVERM